MNFLDNNIFVGSGEHSEVCTFILYKICFNKMEKEEGDKEINFLTDSRPLGMDTEPTSGLLGCVTEEGSLYIIKNF
jgi:hypothetical protein